MFISHRIIVFRFNVSADRKQPRLISHSRKSLPRTFKLLTDFLKIIFSDFQNIGYYKPEFQANMPETTQDTCASAKDSPFFIKNLLNSDSKPSKPKPILASTKAGLDGSFSLSQVGEFNFPRFELPTQRFALPAYLERASAWWYPYTLSASAHLHRTEGKV